MTAQWTEAMKAAYCQLRHGDPRRSEEVKAADKGLTDLIDRTWRTKGEMNRDEKRLQRKYEATLTAAREATLTAYRNCAECNGSELNRSEGATP